MTDTDGLMFVVPANALEYLDRAVERTGQSQGDGVAVSFVVYDAITYLIQTRQPIYMRVRNTRGVYQTLRFTVSRVRWWHRVRRGPLREHGVAS